MSLHFTHLKLILFFLLCFQLSRAQNLVADSSFEANSKVPVLLSSIGLNASWSSPSWGTTDLLCECGKKLKDKSEAQVPHNPFGIQKANTGKCYAGFYLFSHADYREYLITQLNQPLIGGNKYELTMYISLADYSRAAIYRMGVAFLNAKPSYTSSDVIRNINPVNVPLKNQVGTDTVNWHQIVVEYEAHGGEQFLLIGSFDIYDYEETNARPPKGVRTKINQRTDRDAYYYIDDVSLHQLPPPVVAKFDTVVAPIIDTIRPVAIAEANFGNDTTKPIIEVLVDKTFILKNILFETNRAVLLPSSYPELDAFANYLVKNPQVFIEIGGHTDNTGGEEQNKILSEKRANTVADYLITKGVELNRVTFKGYGSTKPIANNSTDEGKKQNRRVEFTVVKK